MSPATITSNSSYSHFDDDLNLSIVGLGVEYPPFAVGPEALEALADRFYPQDSEALKKVLTINRFTGIQTRSTVGKADHPLVNQKTAPNIKQLNTYFRQEGVRLSVNACKKAIAEWGGEVDEITHMVSTTCTNSANPGFDHHVAKQLGVSSAAEKTLLHGIGCSGGLAAIRTGANLALGHSYRKRPARVLVLACEISSLLVRSELDSVVENEEVRIGACLFSDCASACVISNGVGEDPESIYDLLGWRNEVLEDSESDLGFDVDPLGWKVILTQRVPKLAAASVSPVFQRLAESIPSLRRPDQTLPGPADFDWALHPGGATVINGVEKVMQLTPMHLKSSYEVYMEHGNSSSATMMSVMDNLRRSEGGRENVVACAFGPGINIEMAMLRRRSPSSVETSPIDTPPAEPLD